jgi:protein-S-isoprenylcysteine O-methyltransferase Ste14
MELNRQLIRQGASFFRLRSVLPLAVVPLALLAMRDGEFVRTNFGAALDTVWESLCIGIAFAGLALRAFTVGFVPAGTSGRNTRAQKADVLNRTGMYSIVRHPIYLANYVITLGLLMFTESFWFVLVGTLVFWLYYERIMLAEEDFLSRTHADAYADWAAATPAVIPRFGLWKAPDMPFALRSVLAREHTTMFVLVLALTATDVASAWIDGDAVVFDKDWRLFLLAGTVLYLALRFAKKRTHLLSVTGR